mmetsp:Transcript_800/g.2342  ORF Transcript_800/g.2342 Transcript_800/m.2342 type:complete len:208 (+) Transcript_800:421-1044(+)
MFSLSWMKKPPTQDCASIPEGGKGKRAEPLVSAIVCRGEIIARLVCHWFASPTRHKYHSHRGEKAKPRKIKAYDVFEHGREYPVNLLYNPARDREGDEDGKQDRAPTHERLRHPARRHGGDGGLHCPHRRRGKQQILLLRGLVRHDRGHERPRAEECPRGCGQSVLLSIRVAVPQVVVLLRHPIPFHVVVLVVVIVVNACDGIGVVV